MKTSRGVDGRTQRNTKCKFCGAHLGPRRRAFCSTSCLNRWYWREQTGAVFRDIDAFRAKFRRPASRRCLGCGKHFASEGPWNRICARCEQRTERDWTDGLGEEDEWATPFDALNRLAGDDEADSDTAVIDALSRRAQADGSLRIRRH